MLFLYLKQSETEKQKWNGKMNLPILLYEIIFCKELTEQSEETSEKQEEMEGSQTSLNLLQPCHITGMVLPKTGKQNKKLGTYSSLLPNTENFALNRHKFRFLYNSMFISSVLWSYFNNIQYHLPSSGINLSDLCKSQKQRSFHIQLITKTWQAGKENRN